MYVEDKKSGNKIIYVFYFEDQKNFDDFIKSLESKEDCLSEAGKERMNMFIRKFKSRVDGKYANEDSELSGCLFADEAASFMTFLLAII